MSSPPGDTALSPVETASRPPHLVADEFGAELTAGGYAGTERWTVLRRFLAAADFIAALVAGLAGAAVSGVDVLSIVLVTTLVSVAWLGISFVCGLYSGSDLRSWASGVGEAPRLVFAAFVLSWPVFGLVSALGATMPAVGALFTAAGVASIGAASRGLARAIAHSSEPLRERTVIVGSGMVAGQVVEKLRGHPEFGLVPIGVVDDDVHHLGHPDLPTFGRLDELSDILSRHRVDRVIIAFSKATHDQLHTSLRACRDRGVSVDIVPRLFEFLDGARVLDQVGGLPLLSIGAHRLSPSARAAKRALDIALPGLALVLLGPLLVAAAVAIKIESRGPVFFRQPRAGRGGRFFSMLKFRSMYQNADARALEFREDGVIVKDGHDPRVTRVGTLLRRFSIDEVPQLLNVLRGDMSLVGPRPLVVSEANALDERWHERRADLRPGMTGLWQVSGRSRIPFYEMLRFDYQYVAGWSLARDIEILLQTIPTVLSGRGAY